MGREINRKTELLRDLERVFNLGPEDDSTHPMDIIIHGLKLMEGSRRRPPLELEDRAKRICMDYLLIYRKRELLEVKE